MTRWWLARASPGRPLLLAATLLLAAPWPSAGQSRDREAALYQSAVERFRATRSFQEAQQLIGAWTRDQFDAAVTATANQPESELTRAAALFHLELAILGAPQSADIAMLHLRLGSRLASRHGASADASARAFAGRWYATGASLFLAQSDTRRARDVLRLADGPVRGTASLRYVEGIIEDLDAQRFDPDTARDDRSRRSLHLERLARLALADRAYQQALAADPSLVAARIRRGRVLFLLDRRDESRRVLMAAVEDAVEPGDRYLVRLFLAAVHERMGEVAPARTRLEEAAAIAPDRQTAWSALAQFEERHGEVARARAVVREGLARRRDDALDEWWDYRNGALNAADLRWLRTRVFR